MPKEAEEVDVTEIERECIRRIAEAKELPLDAVTLDTSLDALAVDSLDRVSLSFDLEEEYGIQIPESRLQGIRTVGDVAAAVEEAVATKNAGGPVANSDSSAGVD